MPNASNSGSMSRRAFLQRAVIGVGILAAAPLVQACGQAPAPQPTEAPKEEAKVAEPTKAPEAKPTEVPKSSGPVTLKCWKFGGTDAELAYMPEWNQKFEEKTGYKIEWSSLDWGTKREKMLGAFISKNIADVLLPDGQSIPDLVGLNVIEPLEQLEPDMVARWKPNFVPEIWETTVWEGKFYAVSTYVDSAPFLGYNIQMFEEAGIVEGGKAKPPTTWAELKEVAPKLTQPDRPGLIIQASMNTNDANIFEGVAYANGGRWLDDEGKKVVINDAGVVDALQLYVDLANLGAVPKNVTETDFAQAGAMFMNGQGAMWNCMSWIGAFEQGIKPKDLRYSSTLFPRNSTPSGSYPPAATIMTPTTCLMVTTLSTFKKEAMEYLDFWAQPDAQSGWDGSVIWGRVPALKANWETDAFKARYPDWHELYVAGKMFEGSLPMPMFRGLTEIEKLLSVAVQQALLGRQTPKEALDECAEKAQRIYTELNL